MDQQHAGHTDPLRRTVMTTRAPSRLCATSSLSPTVGWVRYGVFFFFFFNRRNARRSKAPPPRPNDPSLRVIIVPLLPRPRAKTRGNWQTNKNPAMASPPRNAARTRGLHPGIPASRHAAARSRFHHNPRQDSVWTCVCSSQSWCISWRDGSIDCGYRS
jgi:hypothetical protein